MTSIFSTIMYTAFHRQERSRRFRQDLVLSTSHIWYIRLSEIRWNLFGDNVNLRLTLYGENGESCHGHIINEIVVKGAVNVPLHIPLLTHWFRTVRVEIKGTMSAGSSIYNVVII